MKSYTFFDTTLGFTTNYLPAYKEFDRIYGYFETRHKSPQIDCRIEKNNNSFHIYARSKRYSLEYTVRKLQPDTYLSLFSPVIYEVKDYFLIHGGSLSTPKDNGLIISAPCGFGKTTLTRELLKSDFGLLSDELAPLCIKTGLVYPYPRGMGVLSKKNKKIIDTPKDRIGKPSRPRIVIFPTLERIPDEHILEVALGRADTHLSPHLPEYSAGRWGDLFKNIDGVKKVTPIHNRLFPMLRLTLEKGTHVVSRIQEMGIPILYALKGRSKAPDFSAVPQLREISPKEGILELGQNILNAHNSALINDTFSGSRPRMIFELAGLLDNVRFYSLSIGRLSEMVRLICQL